MSTSENPPAPSRVPATLAWIGLALVLVTAGVPRVLMARASSPYVLHDDESLTTRRAVRMLRTGDPNPHFFRYPSLPIYATAGAYAVALAAHGEGPSTEIGKVKPFYERPEIGLAGRYLVILLSLLVMVFVGVAAARTFGAHVHLVLAPLLVASSHRFLQLSWVYVNVDMFGAFVCTGAVLHVVLARQRDGLLHRAVLPGLLCGLAVGCKYYLGLVGLPALLVLLRERTHLARNLAAIVACTIAGFLASTPYSVLDAGHFVDQVAIEITHYSEGHGGAEAEPGWPQLLYYLTALRVDFGWIPCLVGLVGIAWGLAKRRFETVLLLAFPVALLLFLVTQRVHFLRNIVNLYALFPVFVSVGAVVLSTAIARVLPRALRALAPAVVALVLVQGAPRAKIEHGYRAPRDSRHAVAAWISANVPRGRAVLLSDDVQIDPRSLPDHEVVQGPLLQFVSKAAIEGYRDLAHAPVLVAPAVDPGTKLEAYYSKPVRRKLDGFEVLWRGGQREVKLKGIAVLHLGNPRVEVLDLRTR